MPLLSFWSGHIRRYELICGSARRNSTHNTQEFRAMVAPFTEADAAQLASLIAELRSQGQMMKFFDTCIAAGALARGDKLLVLDSDFDRLKDRITLLKPT